MASRYQIEDTQGNVFRPITLGTKNVFAFRPGPLEGEEIYPLANAFPADGTIQGFAPALQDPNEDLENRPLELTIRSPLPALRDRPRRPRRLDG